MLKIYIENMSCGHCQIKIKSELESHNYDVYAIDMSQNSVLLDASIDDVHAIKVILDHINYVLDDEKRVEEYHLLTYWNDALEIDSNYESFITYLNQENIVVKGFDEENFGLEIIVSDKQKIDIEHFIKQL